MKLQTLLELKSDQKILLVGIGTEILQFLDWLTGVIKLDLSQICLADKKNISELPAYNLAYFGGVYAGENYLQVFENPNIKFIFKAPGIWSLSPELQNFRNQNGQDSVLSSLSFFIDKFHSQIIGVTGTKGKSTTSSLIQHFLINLGYDSQYCGNTTGISPYQFWTELDQKPTINQKFVIELSSFQLQDLAFSKISPDLSIITNYYIDHQDQHHSTCEYWQAKDQVFVDQNVNGLVITTDSVLQKSTNLSSYPNKIIVNDLVIDSINNQIQHSLLGRHNQSNLAQCLLTIENLESQTKDLELLLKNIKSKKEFYTDLLKTFKPLAHRIELIRTIELDDVNINFYDDGAASEPDAVAAGVRSLTQKPNQFVWLFLTGKDPDHDLDNLIKVLKTQMLGIYKIEFCGKIGQRVHKKLHQKEIEIVNFKNTVETKFANFNQQIKNFEDFISSKSLEQKPILEIVLSPCGKSFDEFKNYLDRCSWWTEQVKNLEIKND